MNESYYDITGHAVNTQTNEMILLKVLYRAGTPVPHEETLSMTNLEVGRIMSPARYEFMFSR